MPSGLRKIGGKQLPTIKEEVFFYLHGASDISTYESQTSDVISTAGSTDQVFCNIELQYLKLSSVDRFCPQRITYQFIY